MVDSSQFNNTRLIRPKFLMLILGKGMLKYVFGTILGVPNVVTSSYMVATILGAIHVLSRTIVICEITFHQR